MSATLLEMVIHAAGVAYLVGDDAGPHPENCSGCDEVRAFIRELDSMREHVSASGSVPAAGPVRCFRCRRPLQNVHYIDDRPYGRTCRQIMEPLDA